MAEPPEQTLWPHHEHQHHDAKNNRIAPNRRSDQAGDCLYLRNQKTRNDCPVIEPIPPTITTVNAGKMKCGP
jgi:hypothetical protein